MDKELYKLILEEIDVNIGDSIAHCDRIDCAEAVVERLENEGYRKADEVRKGTAKEIADWLENRCWRSDFDVQELFLAELIRVDYDVEVDE